MLLFQHFNCGNIIQHLSSLAVTVSSGAFQPKRLLSIEVSSYSYKTTDLFVLNKRPNLSEIGRSAITHGPIEC